MIYKISVDEKVVSLKAQFKTEDEAQKFAGFLLKQFEVKKC